MAVSSSGSTVGMIGLGVMGSAMTGTLLSAGWTVHGYDIDEGRRQAFAELGGSLVSSAAEVARHADLVVFSLPSAGALEGVASELAGADVGGVVCVDTCTLPLDAKRAARDRLAAAGIDLMDVPLSGTGLQAADATLVVLASGSQESFDRALPMLDVIGRSTHYLGEFGAGSVMKYIANLLVAIHNLSTAEAHILGLAAGLDPELVQRVMSDGVGASKVFDIRGPMMVADSYDPPSARLDIILKDGKIISDFARSVGAATPLLDAAMPVYEDSSAAGLGGLDAAALLRFLEQQSGIIRGDSAR